MRLVSMTGPHPKRIPLKRERMIYKLLSLNTGPEKGPDFVAANKRGHLVLGEIKRGSLRPDAWPQIQTYAKKFGEMRWRELDAAIKGVTKKELQGFLSRTAWNAFFSPSRRKLQLVLIAEDFSDQVLRRAARKNLNARLQRVVKDVKCIQIQTFHVKGHGEIAVASGLSGRRRKLRR
jgi:hypothetical protein